MKPLNKTATKIFNSITEDMEGNRRNYKKIDNTNDTFMPLVVEKVGTYDIGNMYSFAHYFKQNGDMCQDPEMCFIVHKSSGKVFPCMFQQAIPPVYEESLFMDDGKWKFKPAMQKDHVSFANMWLKNIKDQQSL